MKKGFLSTFLFVSFIVNAQLPPNSFGNDFTISAYQPWLSTEGMDNNGTYNLYDYLDQGYTVFVDYSATWCSPCWNYHNTGAFEDLYAAHGPAGYPGVDPGTTNDVMVFWFDGDLATSDATLTSGGVGNWIEPSPGHKIQYPMANPANPTLSSITTSYGFLNFPEFVKICPNRLFTQIGKLNASELYDMVGNCPPPATEPIDAAMITFNVEPEFCPGNSLNPSVIIQNHGTSSLNSASVSIELNGNVVSTGTLIGTLDTYEIAEINCSAINPTNSGTLVAKVFTVADTVSSNNSITSNIISSPVATNLNATVKVVTDAYGSELTWDIKNSAGTVVASGGPYIDEFVDGEYPQADVNFTLVSNECYKINLTDLLSNGFDSGNGNGSFKVQVGGSDLVVFPDWNTFEISKTMTTSYLGVIEDYELLTYSVYPNPTSSNVTISFNGNGSDYKVEILDLVGRSVLSDFVTSANGLTEVSLITSELKAGNYLVSISNGTFNSTQNLTIK